MALHTFGNNSEVGNAHQETSTNVDAQETSTNVDANNCPLLGQESSSTSDLNPEVLNEKNEVVQVVDQKQQDQEVLQEMPEIRLSDIFPSLDDEGKLVNPDLGPVVLNHEDMQALVKANNSLLNDILDFVKNDEKDEVVRDYLEKFFEGLNDKPFKKYVGSNGVGWYALYHILLRYKHEEKMLHVFHGLILIQKLQDKSGLLMSSFNPDMLVEADPTLYQLTSRLYNLGHQLQEGLSAGNPDSKLDKMMEEQMEALSEVTKEVVKEASRAISSGGGYSEPIGIWDVLKWGAIAAGVIGGGYLAYKGYQSLTEDDPNDVVFIDIDDHDTGHLDFI